MCWSIARSLVLAVALALIAAPAAAAKPATIDVHPGPNAISKALAGAQSGDTLRLHTGHYRESFEITKRVSLVAAHGAPPVIDGRCKTSVVIAVRSAGVLLDGLTVIGGSGEFGPEGIDVDFSGVPTGTARDLSVKNTCGSDESGAAYGINVFSSKRITVAGNSARGFLDSGIYVGGITNTAGGALTVARNEAFGNNRGVIVEDSAGGKVVVSGNELRDNRLGGEGDPAGLFLHNSDGVRVSGNSLTHNGAFGIDIDPTSDKNVLTGNTASANPTDLLNEGSDNCGSKNKFKVVSGNPLVAC